MQTFFMYGKYTADSIRGMSTERTREAVKTIDIAGGKVESIYALLGDFDLVMIVKFPKMEAAMKASVALNQLTGINISTVPALIVEEFDKLIGK